MAVIWTRKLSHPHRDAGASPLITTHTGVMAETEAGSVITAFSNESQMLYHCEQKIPKYSAAFDGYT